MTPLRRLLLKDLVILSVLGLLLAGSGVGWLWYRSLLRQGEREALSGLRSLHRDLGEAFQQVEAAGRLLGGEWSAGRLDLAKPEQTEARTFAVVRQLPLASSAFLYQPGQGGVLVTLTDLRAPIERRAFTSFLVPPHGTAGTPCRIVRESDQPLIQDKQAPLGLDPKDRPWFRHALRTRAEGWAEPYPFYPLESSGGLTFVVPLRRPGGPLEGALGVDLLLEDLVERVWTLQPTPGSLVAVTDAQGRALLLPRMEAFAQPEARRAAFLKPVGPSFLPVVDAVLRQGRELEAVSLKVGGRSYLCARQPMKGPEGVAWTLSLAVPMDELLAPARRAGLALLGLSLALVVLLAWRLHAISKRFADPLMDLARAADGLRRGEVPNLPGSSVAEIQALGQALSRAAEALREKTRLQSQLQHSQRLETLGTLSGGIAHDVNNQLGAVLGQLELAEESLPTEHPARQRLRRAVEAVQRCAKTTRALLTFSHQSQPELRPLDLNTLVKDTAVLLERVLGGLIHMELDLHPQLPPVQGEPVQLEQVLMNLAVNARDAMPEGGTLTLRTLPGPPGWVRLEVADTGKGIPADLLPHIFEPFFTTKAVGKGTGLGLAMVFGILRSHKGRISVTSELGKGTTFTAELPSAATAAAQPSGAHIAIQASEGSLAGLRILVAEDELDLRDTLADALTVARAQVATAKDGEEAWILFSQGRFDLVLSDQRMPRATGMDLYRRIRAQDGTVPFILASGQDLEPFRAELAQDPKLRLLAKPFSVARLIELVDQLRS